MQTFHKDRNLPNNKCDEGFNVEMNFTVRVCIEKAIDSIMGCHIPWHTNRIVHDHEDCSTESQYLTYADLTERLASMGARQTRSYILIYANVSLEQHQKTLL